MRKTMMWLMSMALVLGMAGCGNAADSDDHSPAAGGEMAESVQMEVSQAETETQNESSTENETGAENTDYSDVEFRISWWGGDARNTQTVEIIENFEMRYPNLKIDVEYGEFGDHFTRLTTQATAGNLPDVYMMDYSKMNEFVNSGQLEQLDSYMESKTIDLSDVDDSFLSGGIVDGGMYAITTGINAPCFYYDPVVLEELNLSLNQAPKWKELIEVIETVYEKTGKKAFMEPNEASLGIYLRSMGKSIYAEDNTGYGFEPEDLAAYLEIFYNLYESGAATSSAEYNGEIETCLQDDSGIWLKMWEDGFSNSLILNEEQAGKRLSLCTYPSADETDESGTFLKPTMLWGISSTSENKELAAAFINYFVNDAFVYDVCGMDRGVPISASMRDHISSAADETEKYILDFINYLSDGVATAISPAAPTGAAEADSNIVEVYEQLYYGQLRKEELLDAADEAMAQGNAILAKNAADK